MERGKGLEVEDGVWDVDNLTIDQSRAQAYISPTGSRVRALNATVCSVWERYGSYRKGN